MESRERTKLFIVIGLSVVFFATGYFRLLQGKIAFFKQPESGIAIPAMTEVPAVDLKGLRPAGEPPPMASAEPRRVLRDIFVPVRTPAAEIARAAAAVVPLKPLPSLHLAGTIVGGKRSLAIINGQFLRKGEKVAGFEVVSITRDQVILSGEGRKVLLNTLTGVEERSP